jgi:hypothetical protein
LDRLHYTILRKSEANLQRDSKQIQAGLKLGVKLVIRTPPKHPRRRSCADASLHGSLLLAPNAKPL